ncbi:MFS transporter [Microcella flavibacter]|uniref:MFS transporter n=1 Tax=Microcella flavibacter TaxID=1804990 RepID=UPI0014567479|nr:MFS transporter [Microcella flavibacter]
MLSVLRDRRFAALFGSQVSSLVGTGVLTVALALLAVRLEGDEAGRILGIALTIRIAAYVLVSPIASALLAGRSSRGILLAADAARLLVAGGLVLATEAWHIYLAIVLLQSASAVFTPTYQAVIPEVLADERDYTAAQSLSRLAYDLESLLSPVIAALLVLVLPAQALFAVTAAGFLLSGVGVLLSRIDITAGGSAEPFRGRLTRGLRLLARTPALRFLAVLDAATAAVYATVLVSTVVLLLDAGVADASDPSAPLAVALVLFGAGSIVVALLLPRILTRIADRALMAAGAALAAAALAATAALAIADALSLLALGALWILLGAATSAISTPSARLIRRDAVEADRPAVFAARFSTSHAWYLLMYPTAGLVGAAAGPGAATAALAALCLLALAAALALGRPARAADDPAADPAAGVERGRPSPAAPKVEG